MSASKAAGIETEYGIMSIGSEESDPFLASDAVLNAYRSIGKVAVPCYPNKRPSMKDIMLANGARLYIDHGHPEYSTPECLSPRRLVIADKAGERILADCQHQVNVTAALPHGQRVAIYKNNSDYKDNSYGCHENYLLDTELFIKLFNPHTSKVLSLIVPFLVTRIIFCGSGKVGTENGRAPVGFQLSQRADFFETLIGLQTTERRPLFNTRDEGHSDSARFRRLHVIVGDANMAELSTYLKVGSMQLFLHMLEDNFIHDDLTLADPLATIRLISRDLTFRQPFALKNGQRMTAVEMQGLFLERAQQYLKEREGSEEQWEVWEEWEDTVSVLSQQWQKLATRLDWAIKKRLLDRYLEAQGVTWEEHTTWQPIIEVDDLEEAKEGARRLALRWSDYEKQRELYFALKRLNLDYHSICHDPQQGEVGLFYRLQQSGAIERLSTDEEIRHYISSPPPDTRAWLRGQCISRFSNSIISADWDAIEFAQSQSMETGETYLSLSNPLMGTQAALAPIWDQIHSSSQLTTSIMQQSETPLDHS
jgi:proteasome accessory factor A